MSEGGARTRKDWVGGYRSYILAWGLPTCALIGAIWLAPPAKTVVWTLSLLWMGGACLANAVRCGRMHCYFTGPFFLLMAVATSLHGIEVVWLGPNGWLWLGLAIGTGIIGIWRVTERVWGKYANQHR